MLLRRADPGDAPDIARIIRTVWSDSNPDPYCVARAIQDEEHATLVAVVDGVAAGFVDAFPTSYVTPLGSAPHFWEVDLLAVEPAFHRRGIGRALIEAAREAGIGAGRGSARALVRADNVSAQAAFERAGFTPQSDANTLYTANGLLNDNPPDIPADCRLIIVNTLVYSGIWLEGTITQQSLRYGRHVAGVRGLETVGAVIPRANEAAIRAARAEGYDPIGDYRWWTYAYISG